MISGKLTTEDTEFFLFCVFGAFNGFPNICVNLCSSVVSFLYSWFGGRSVQSVVTFRFKIELMKGE